MPAGELDEDGQYPEDSLLRAAVDKAREYWVMASGKPMVVFAEEEEEEEEEEGGEKEEEIDKAAE